MNSHVGKLGLTIEQIAHITAYQGTLLPPFDPLTDGLTVAFFSSEIEKKRKEKKKHTYTPKPTIYPI